MSIIRNELGRLVGIGGRGEEVDMKEDVISLYYSVSSILLFVSREA